MCSTQRYVGWSESCDPPPVKKHQSMDYSLCARDNLCNSSDTSSHMSKEQVTAFDDMKRPIGSSESMDHYFKEYYALSLYSVLHKVEPDRLKEINNVMGLWDRGVQLIDHRALNQLFWKQCHELSLPADTFDFNRAYELAATDWRIELMLAVTQRNLIDYIEHLPWNATGLLVWDVTSQRININRTVCENYAQMLKTSTLQKLNMVNFHTE